MCAVNAGGCVIDLFVQGWASTSSLLCLVTGNSANTDNSPVPTSPFCIPPYQAWRVAGGRWNIVAAFRGMHVSPAKHSSAGVTDGQTDRRTDRQTDRRTDGRRTKWSLCVAMLRRWHKNHLRYSHTFPTNRPDRESNPGRQCDRPEC